MSIANTARITKQCHKPGHCAENTKGLFFFPPSLHGIQPRCPQAGASPPSPGSGSLQGSTQPSCTASPEPWGTGDSSPPSGSFPLSPWRMMVYSGCHHESRFPSSTSLHLAGESPPPFGLENKRKSVIFSVALSQSPPGSELTLLLQKCV